MSKLSPDLLTIREFAKALGLKRNSLYGQIRFDAEAGLPVIELDSGEKVRLVPGERTLLVPRSELDRLSEGA